MKNRNMVLMCLLLMSVGLYAGDWPQFQGPTFNGVARETGLMKTWPKGGPKVLWRVDIGKGFGGAAAEGGEVFMLDREGDKKDVLRCWSLKDGNPLWKVAFDAPERIPYPGSRCTPAVDKKYVAAMGPGKAANIYVVNRLTQKPLWRKSLAKEFGSKAPHFAMGMSPVFYKDWVIVTPMSSKAGVAALEKATGKVAWTSDPLPGKMAYCTPMIMNLGGEDQAVVVTFEGMFGVDLATGKICWANKAWAVRNPIPSPLHLGNGRIFVSNGYGGGAALFQVTKAGDGYDVKTLFKTKACNGLIHNAVFHDNHLYINGNNKRKNNRPGLMCLNLKGEVKWKTGPALGFDWGGYLLADGMIYVVDGNSGDLCMVKPDPEKYNEAGRTHILNSGARDQLWAPISMADGKILMRDQKELVCVDVKGK